MESRYIIWGTGWEAEQFYYQYHNKIDILCFMDNINYGKKFYEFQIEKPELTKLRGGKILIATSMYYKQIKKQLQEMGFIEYKDFNYCFNIDKKIVFINGNCHCEIIGLYLKSSPQFSKEYIFGDWPLIFQKVNYDERILKYCDLFIHQDIRKDNTIEYKYSDEYILPKLRDDCVKLCIPNLYGFPKALFYKNYNLAQENHTVKWNPFLYHEELIEQYMSNHMTFECIMRKLNEDCVNKNDILIQFEKDKKWILEREKNWDIKISDFIWSKYKEIQLFYDVGHPTNILLKEIANRILIYLEIEEVISEEINKNLGCYEVPVYNCIKNTLKLDWDNYYLRKRDRNIQLFALQEKDMDLEEYVREYIWWYYGIDVRYRN